MNGEHSYLAILNKVLTQGERKENRTGVGTFAIPPITIEHDMSEGFPLLTTKKVPFKLIASELQFFIQGMTSKLWLQAQNNHIWDEWASAPQVEEIMRLNPQLSKKESQLYACDLGPIYGHQWRRFGQPSEEGGSNIGRAIEPKFKFDQLANIVYKLKNNPNDRRMVCSAWSPTQLEDMALPPCHLMWIVNHINGKLHLHWTQRSADLFLGVPFNLASYALLLHLLCKEANMVPGTVTGSLVDCHIYENHLNQVKEQLSRTPTKLPSIETINFKNIFSWNYADTMVHNYSPQAAIKADVAI